MKVQDLPQPFQDRIARFNRLFQAGTEDHHDFEHHFDDGKPGLFQYEMFCIETALAFAELLPTKEAFDTFMDECEKEYKENPPTKWDWETDEDYQERINKGPLIYEVIEKLSNKYPDNKIREDEHSNNTMGFSWLLFVTYIERPDLVQYAHGAMAPLIGDEGYYDDRSDVPELPINLKREMKTYIRKLSQKSINLLNKTKSYPAEKIVEGYHIVGPNRALFAEKPLYIFLEKFVPTGKYNIRYGGSEIKKALKGKLKDYEILSIVTSYCSPETQKRLIAEALIDKDFKLGWKIIKKLSKKLLCFSKDHFQTSEPLSFSQLKGCTPALERCL